MRFFFIGFLFCFLTATLTAQKIKVACVGNSVTYGYLLPDREQNCYPAQLARMLGDRYEVRNFGKSGATLLNKGHRPYMQQSEFKEALAFAGDLVVIHLGLNDTDPRNWPNYRDEFLPDYLALIDSFRVVNPKCQIWICRMSPITNEHPRFKSGTRDWYEQIQETIEQVAEVAKVGLIDLQEGLYNRPDLLSDALHPNVEGASILAKSVYSGITGDFGGLSMSALWGDGMVLQRDRVLKIKGVANAGDLVTVRFGRQTQTASTLRNGRWEVKLEAMPAGGPYVMTVKTKGKSLEFKNILLGEVWLCSGQSNMAFRVNEGVGVKEVIAASANDRIRLYNLKPRVITDAVSWDSAALVALNRLDYYCPTKWESAAPGSVADFSAIAYYFGKMLSDSLHVPIGLICNAVGGAPAEAFIDRKALEFNHQLVDILYHWTKNDMIQDWARGRAVQNMKNSPVKRQRHPYEPCYLYDTGIRPLADFAIKGVIWYQGESNAHNVELHESIFPVLVDSWRRTWHEDLPFYYVQLSSLNRPSWPHFRNSQREMLSKIEHSGMAVSSDLGNPTDVHPKQKRPVGERLAFWALNKTYGLKQVVPSGPLYKSVDFRHGAAYVEFEYGQGMKTSDGQALRTFEVAGKDGLYSEAEAVVEDGRIKVSSPKVPIPIRVRYGWQPYTTANLVNGAGIPASTFRSEGGSGGACDKGVEVKVDG